MFKDLWLKLKSFTKAAKNKIIALLGVGAVSSLMFVGGVSIEQPDATNLVGYWPFEEGSGTVATDHSVNSNEATFQNTPTWVQGRVGNALNFDGFDESLALDGLTIPNSDTTYTVSAWVNLESTGSSRYVYSQTSSSDNFSCVGCLYYNGTNFFFLSRDNVGGNSAAAAGTTEPVAGTWYFITGVRDGSNTYIYVNGIQEGSDNDAGGTISTNEAFIGKRRPGGSSTAFFDGKIDEVRAYDTALSAADILEIYENSRMTKITLGSLREDNLIAYWRFDELAGSDVIDSVSPQVNGTINGDVTRVDGYIKEATNYAANATNPRVELVWDDKLDLTGSGTQWTVGAWLRQEATVSNPRYVFAVGNAGETQATNLNMTLQMNNRVPRVVYETGSGTDHGVTSSETLDLDTWYYVAGTYDGTDLKIYVNGIERGSLTSTTPPDTTSNTARIGVLQGSESTTRYRGDIDELRFWDVALTAEDLVEIASKTGPDKVMNINSSQNDKLTDGLVSSWSFNGPDLTTTTATDGRGTNDGTLTNGPVPAIGRVGQALDFDGVNDYVSAGDLSATEDKTFSYSFWIKTTQTGTGRYIIGEGSTASANPITAVSMENGKARLFVRASGDITVTSSASINDGDWHHVVATADGTTGRIYVDGEFQTSGLLPGGTLALNTFTIGALERTSVALYTDAIIDEARVYDRELTADEVKHLYRLGS